MLNRDTSVIGVVNVIIATVFWGTTGTAASFIPDVSPLATGAFAMGVGGLLLVVNAHSQLFNERHKLFAQSGTLLSGAAAITIYPLAFYSSMHFSGVAIGTLISIASGPFFAVLLERLISKKAISIKWYLSFAVGVSGIVLLTLGKQSNSEVMGKLNLHYWGVFLGLSAGVTYALYSWSARRMIEAGISAKSSMAGMFALAALFLLPSLLLTGKNAFCDAQHISIMLYMAIIPMFLGYLCFGVALQQMEASKATLITLLEPVIATLFAVSIIGEKFAAIGWLGMGLVILCMLLQVIKWPVSKDRISDLY